MPAAVVASSNAARNLQLRFVLILCFIFRHFFLDVSCVCFLFAMNKKIKKTAVAAPSSSKMTRRTVLGSLQPESCGGRYNALFVVREPLRTMYVAPFVCTRNSFSAKIKRSGLKNANGKSSFATCTANIISDFWGTDLWPCTNTWCT